MKIMLKLLSALLYFNFLSVVSTYYLFQDKPSDTGYISPMQGASYASFGNMHMKRYSGNAGSKFIRGDSTHNGEHKFNVMKTPIHSFAKPQPWKANDRTVQLVTESPTILERPKHEASVSQPAQRDSREEGLPKVDPLTNPNVNRPQVNVNSKGILNDNYQPQVKEKPLEPSFEMYKTMEVNVNKSPMVSKVNRNRFTGSLSINSFPNYYRRLQSANMGMHGHKPEKYSDSNAPLLHKMLENMSNNLPARKPKTYDFRKRDTSGNIIRMYVVPNQVLKDDVIKYSSKEMANEHIKNADSNSFGGAEVNVVRNDKPYAVFYRMNPVALAPPAEMAIHTMDVDAAVNKEAVNAIAQDDISHPRDNVHHGSVKIHKTIKNYSSYNKYY